MEVCLGAQNKMWHITAVAFYIAIAKSNLGYLMLLVHMGYIKCGNTSVNTHPIRFMKSQMTHRRSHEEQRMIPCLSMIRGRGVEMIKEQHWVSEWIRERGSVIHPPEVSAMNLPTQIINANTALCEGERDREPITHSAQIDFHTLTPYASPCSLVLAYRQLLFAF